MREALEMKITSSADDADAGIRNKWDYLLPVAGFLISRGCVSWGSTTRVHSPEFRVPFRWARRVL